MSVGVRPTHFGGPRVILAGPDGTIDPADLPTNVDGMVPYYIAAGDTFTVPEFKQGLFTELIDNAGTLDVIGLLIEVD